jgi:hypothetical protein
VSPVLSGEIPGVETLMSKTKTKTKTKTVLLMRVRASENEAYPSLLIVRDDVADPVAALRAAAVEFLKSDASADLDEGTRRDFNWGDATVEIPGEILLKHGILEVQDMAEGHEVVYVDQDELLGPTGN